MSFVFQSVPKLVCEIGGLARTGELMAGLGARRVVVVCDAGIRACGFAAKAAASLRDAGIEPLIHDGVQADPPVAVVLAAVDAAREFGADGVAGLGGGSSLDTAKLVALLLRSEQKIEEMFGTDLATGKRSPLIQIPTTAGTGSEVTWVSVVTNAAGEKKAVYSRQLLPDIAILDAELTVGMPPKVTAATALDAMVHAVEAYTSRTRKNPIADCLALKALDLLCGNYAKVLRNGHDMAARAAMLQGAMLGGMAFINASVASVHALAYPLGARFHVPHGHSNALVMGPVFRFNLPVAAGLYAELASAVLPGQGFANASAAAEAFVAELDRLAALGGLEMRMGKLGVSEDDIPSMAQEVTVGIQRLLANNPRDMTQTDVEELYRSIL
ncbi:alcohol dehydrogenase [Paramagnetospirillum marisnigri]|uniref:Alcohol dehydrogenase n=1 Tax=Paramagnetospirillum marisnigri TaxID=1285242 RepID=A0A178MF55_9PROT|nr:iron-containing alcohol dehydrogenase [Paramagnetospirillum marisnigri]OAN46718.1 alcohol dehydrogenase [Paramagnetospirillum marisnigri]